MGRFLISAASSFAVLLLVVADIAQLSQSANSSISSSSSPPCIERERRALVEFKASLNDPTNWLSSWKGVHCCQWEGVVCDNATAHVLKLLLKTPFQTCLSSPISRHFYKTSELDECEELYDRYVEAADVNPSLLQLEYLTHLDLTGNHFNYSEIPTFIGSMQRLRYLSLSDAHFGGRIPNRLGKLKNLQFLDLSWNSFDLEASDDINWISALGSLEHLDMNGVYFGNNTDKLFQQLEYMTHFESMQRLKYLSLIHAGLRGRIPNSLGSLTNLQFLDLSGNYDLGGRIPNSLGNLTNLQYLDLSWNYNLEASENTNWMSRLGSLEHLVMSGVFYSNNTHKLFQQVNLTNAPQLQVLILADNGLTVSDLDGLQNMTSSSLVHLDLSGNYLTSVPLWFGNFEKLEFLDLSGGELYGSILDVFNYSQIPTFIGSMQQLRYLSLSHAHFGGRIPNSLGNLTNLQFLDLSENFYLEVSDDINWISRLESLEYIDMSYIFFGNSTSKLSPQVNLTNAPQLQVLILAGNGLTLLDLDGLRSMTSSLVHLDLSRNDLTSIPLWFGNFEKLEFLDLSECGLYGAIPDALKNMTSIETLYLRENGFDFVPSWFRKFEKIKDLDLSFNGFRGPIPDTICHMSSLEYLHLTRNLFTSVPSCFVELKTLLNLDLAFNQLTSMECSISLILRTMCHLKSLDLSYNMLQENSIGRNELSACIRYDLNSLDLGGNKFSTRLPSWLVQQENLMYLNLERNLFYGLIPFSFKKFSELRVLDLSNNKLEGPLSNSMGYLLNLRYLDLSNNYFNGSMPQTFAQLVNLEHLDLSNNHLKDTILQCLDQLEKIESLDLSNNNLNDTIPQSFFELSNLYYLNLSRNELHGSIPDKFDQLMNLMRLDLSSNNLDGIIMGKITFLSYLDLSNNQISGSIPVHIGQTMPNLVHLLLGNNLINGSIPYSLCQIQLRILDISNNSLAGEIPNCWKDNKRWEEINLSSNKLVGVFPSSIENLSTLSWLHLNNNSLHGELPVYVKTLKQLLILDLGENNFSGNIPTWTTHTFPSLQVLRLRQNKLSGSIPSQLCQLSTLKILDLSRNNLQGSIPYCIGNLRGMILNKSTPNLTPNISIPAPPGPKGWSDEDVKQVMKGMDRDYTKNLVLVVNMDLSENKLVGVIPTGITLLNGLHGLNLSNNNFKREIPKMIGDMKSLESFDVSNNQLSGTIPSSMSALTYLSHLNLSHNNFSGPIPTGYQFSTYDQSSYVDNPYPCGLPLPKKCPGGNSAQAPMNRGFEDEDDKTSKLEKWLFYLVVAAGFATGFWGVIGVLFFKKSWRHAYFRWVEDIADKIYVATAVQVAKLKKRD